MSKWKIMSLSENVSFLALHVRKYINLDINLLLLKYWWQNGTISGSNMRNAIKVMIVSDVA